MSERDEILASLELLFELAEREHLWFRCHYQGFWLSPKQLRAEHAKDKLVWGPVNWELADPHLRIGWAEEELAKCKEELAKREYEYLEFKAGRL